MPFILRTDRGFTFPPRIEAIFNSTDASVKDLWLLFKEESKIDVSLNVFTNWIYGALPKKLWRLQKLADFFEVSPSQLVSEWNEFRQNTGLPQSNGIRTKKKLFKLNAFNRRLKGAADYDERKRTAKSKSDVDD